MAPNSSVCTTSNFLPNTMVIIVEIVIMVEMVIVVEMVIMDKMKNIRWKRRIICLFFLSVKVKSWYVGDVFTKKNCCSFGFCPNEGRGGPCPFFWASFHKCIFGREKYIFKYFECKNAWYKTGVGISDDGWTKNIARIANAVQVTICLLVSASVY